jgi:hypothetical protein
VSHHRRLRAVTVVSETYRSSVVCGDGGLPEKIQPADPIPCLPHSRIERRQLSPGGESTGGAAATPSSFRSIGWGRTDQARVDLSFSRGGAPSSHAAASTSSSEACRRRARARRLSKWRHRATQCAVVDSSTRGRAGAAAQQAAAVCDAVRGRGQLCGARGGPARSTGRVTSPALSTLGSAFQPSSRRVRPPPSCRASTRRAPQQSSGSEHLLLALPSRCLWECHTEEVSTHYSVRLIQGWFGMKRKQKTCKVCLINMVCK